MRIETQFTFALRLRRKVIRAVLTSEDRHGGISHNLDIMVDMIPDENPIKPLLREMESLGNYATTFRYPSVAGRVKPSPKGEDFTHMATHVEKALNEAIAQFDVDLASDGQPAGHANPIR